MEHQEVEKLHRELLDLLFLLQHLSSTQIRALCQFVQANQGQDSPYLLHLIPLLQRATTDQVRRFVALVTKQITPDQYDLTRRELEELADEYQIPPREVDTTLGLLFGLYQLHGLLRGLSILQLMKLFEIIMIPGEMSTSQDQGHHMQQLQLLQQIQQIFTQLEPEVLQRFHQQLGEALPGTEQQILMQLLNLPAEYFQLYQPLKLLLQLDLDELLRLKQIFASILPVQMLMLLQLLQQQPFDVLDLRNILNLDDGMNISDPSIYDTPSISQIPMDPEGNPPQQEKRISIQITEQPPEKSVYKRNLKPNPMVMLVGDQKLNDGTLYVSCGLIRCDTLQEEPKFITGNRPIKVTSGRIVTFRKLKITTTSHQQQETLFCLRFELRKYTGEDEYEVIDTVHSNPLCVMSHSTQMKPTPTNAPTITEVIPNCGPTTGGTRVAILGSNFVENPAARIRFDSGDVMPVFHGPGTLICHTPQHPPGTVHVKVCNAAKKWSDTVATFTFIEPDVYHAQNPQSSTVQTSPSSMTDAAWQGNFDAVRRIQDSNNGSGGSINLPDHRGFTGLQYAAAQGFLNICALLLEYGANCEYRDPKCGNTALHWAVINGQQEVIKALVEHGADPNATNFWGYTALALAVLEEQLDTAEFLLENGSNANIASVHGISPLHAAAAKGSADIVRLLIKNGAYLNSRDEELETPLFFALRENHPSVAQILIEAGADPNVQNSDGETPFEFVGQPNVEESYRKSSRKPSEAEILLPTSNKATFDNLNSDSTPSMVKIFRGCSGSVGEDLDGTFGLAYPLSSMILT
eukprot:TRINITY_DN4814_c0_g1_i3.p1 TRINITY_DN4814_c0_g1~~TRINITY_DN4814_c0_g1_i3.p1  ORF type:complete len:804 (-),score=200.33 TRINITY_DN4814_c0_g1_i3:47-2458(-)